ncbi:ArnT family glycosyltransferase [Arhodomonas sp. AD133]|uniref:ArnT family glycosyltransferase n=1 Tax=Arhodomonas sp. AD133 TaxID=3415009 RepID=UPI003EB8C456
MREVWRRLCRHEVALVVAVGLVSAVIQSVYFFETGRALELRPAYPNSDAFFYWHAGWYRAFVDWDGGFAGAVMPNDPYVYLLALAHRVLGPSFSSLFALNSVFVVLCAIFVALAANVAYGRVAAWAAGLMTALCAPIVFFSGMVIKTVFVLFLLPVAIFAFFRFLRSGGLGGLFILVLSVGIATLERPNLGVASVVLVVVATGRALWPRGELPSRLARTKACVTILLAIGFVWIIGGLESDRLEQDIVSPVGLNFYVGNVPEARGGHATVPGLRDDVVGHRLGSGRVLTEKLGYRPSRWEQSEYWFEKTIDRYREEPLSYSGLLARKVVALFSRETYGLPEQFGVWRWHRSALAMAFVDFSVVLSFVAVTLASGAQSVNVLRPGFCSAVRRCTP